MNDYLKEMETAVEDLVAFLNKLEIRPRRNVLLDSVSLGMVSKAVRLFRAVISLVHQGFFEEAYGLARSSVELRINARWIANQDSDRRSREFFYFGSKQVEHFNKLAETYMPSYRNRGKEDEVLKRISSLYKRHQRWTETDLKSRAMEPSTRQFDAKKAPSTITQTYETVYWSMCSFCHVDIAALMYGDHVPTPRMPFAVSESTGAAHHGLQAAQVSGLSVFLAVEYALEAMNMSVPQHMQDLFFKVLTFKNAQSPTV